MALYEVGRDELVVCGDYGHFVSDVLGVAAGFHSDELVADTTFFKVSETFHLVVVAVFKEETSATVGNEVGERVEATEFPGDMFVEAWFFGRSLYFVGSVFNSLGQCDIKK
jgi:hypothetical protein